MEHDHGDDHHVALVGQYTNARALSLVDSRGLWQATLILLLFLIGLGLLLILFAPSLTGLVDGTGRLRVGLVLTIVPALLWLALFYHRLPLTHHDLLSVFVLGALMGGAVQQPLLRELFELQRWVVPSTTTHLLVAILLQGILTASLIYLAVRFSIMRSEQFNERIHGIIYGTAAALGLAVAVNLTYILENGTITIGVGTLTILMTSLAYASFGALVGYFLGLIKPGGHSSLLAPFGVLLTAIIDGLYEWLSAQFQMGGIGYNPWPSLIITSIFVTLTFTLLFWLIPSTSKTPNMAKGGHHTTHQPPVTAVGKAASSPPRADGMIFILLIVALSAGWWLRQDTLFATVRIPVQGIELSIPSRSLRLLTSDDTYAIITSSGLTLRINILPAPAIGVNDPVALMTNRAMKQSGRYELYQAIKSDLYNLAEHPAGVLEYVYVDTNNDHFFVSPIQIIHGYELLIGQGKQLYVLTLEAPENKWEEVEALWPRLRDSLRLTGGTS